MLVAALAPAAAVVCAQAGTALSLADAKRLREKVARIVYHGNRPAPPSAPLRTVVTERELNAYLTLDSAGELPVGVTEPALTIHDERRVSARAVVDLDAVRAHHKSTGMLDPVNLLGGRLPVAAVGAIEAKGGKARLQLESVSVAGLPVPVMVLREIVAYYTRSPEYPRGVNIDDPFPLPSRIKAIELRRGEALVVQ
jgi:hypothetical protein